MKNLANRYMQDIIPRYDREGIDVKEGISKIIQDKMMDFCIELDADECEEISQKIIIYLNTII